MDVEISNEALDALFAAARAASPREACGILLGQEKRVTALLETANVHPTPHTHFEIDPQALIDAHRAAREGGAQVLGYFHSHPEGPAKPSATDTQMAAHDGMIWAIAGRPDDGGGEGHTLDEKGYTEGGSQSYTLDTQGYTSGEKGHTSRSFDVTFWRDDQPGFTRLSYQRPRR